MLKSFGICSLFRQNLIHTNRSKCCHTFAQYVCYMYVAAGNGWSYPYSACYFVVTAGNRVIGHEQKLRMSLDIYIRVRWDTSYKICWHVDIVNPHPQIYTYIYIYIWRANGPLARYVKLRVAYAPGMSGTFSPPPRVSDPDMHHTSRTCRDAGRDR